MAESKGIVTTRNYQHDNLRFFLIFLVILGHGMELFSNASVTIIYRVIYSFHMPTFIYLTGKYSKFDKKKIIKHLILPYFVFQTAYQCFDSLILKGQEILIQYSTPYWILWYLMAITIYYLFIPMLPSKNFRSIYVVFAGSILTSLLVGYETSISYYLTLSRTLVFAPFFLWGYYGNTISMLFSKWLPKRNIKIYKVVISLLIICLGERFIFHSQVPTTLLYGSYSYSACGANITSRAVVLVTAAAWIVLFSVIVSKQRIPFITSFGQKTMPIFLFHGFAIRLMGKFGILRYSTKVNLLILCVVTIAIISLFGNKYFNKLFSKIF